VFGNGSAIAKVSITLAALASASLVGVAGARWLTNEVDKKVLQASASAAASAQPDVSAAVHMAVAAPAQALTIAQGLAKAQA